MSFRDAFRQGRDQARALDVYGIAGGRFDDCRVFRLRLIKERERAAEAGSAVQEIQALGRDAFAFRADVANRDEVRALVDSARERFGGIDVLVSNAGLLQQKPFAQITDLDHLQKLLRYICEKGFEHHVAANLSTVASAVHEATTRYLGWDMYWHGRDNGAC